jgi:hypothetical protein
MRIPTVVLVGLVLLGVGVFAAPASASDATTAKQLLVTKADAGANYTASKGTTNKDTFPQLAACVGTPVPKRVVTAHVEGPDLTNSQDGSLITSSVDFVKTAAMAKTDRSIVSNPKFADCITQIAQKQLSSEGVAQVTSQPVSVKPYGTFSAAVESHVSGTNKGRPVDLTIVQVGILKGRAELGESFVTNGAQPFDQATAQAILDKVNQRLGKAKV